MHQAQQINGSRKVLEESPFISPEAGETNSVINDLA